VTFTDGELAGATFTDATLVRVRFTDSDALAVKFDRAKLEDVEFRDVNLRAAVFDMAPRSVRFSNTTCPDGRNSDEIGGTCEGGHM
jgi:uncharacterized protein YjbI with pentapeptide repeats